MRLEWMQETVDFNNGIYDKRSGLEKCSEPDVVKVIAVFQSFSDVPLFSVVIIRCGYRERCPSKTSQVLPVFTVGVNLTGIFSVLAFMKCSKVAPLNTG